jgi:hypothetical protein
MKDKFYVTFTTVENNDTVLVLLHGNQAAVFLTACEIVRLFLSQRTIFPKQTIRLAFVKHKKVFYFYF